MMALTSKSSPRTPRWANVSAWPLCLWVVLAAPGDLDRVVQQRENRSKAFFGAALASVGSRGFPDALANALHQLTPFPMMNGFFYSPNGRAFDLYNEKIVAERSIIVDRYLAGAFVLDPFYEAVSKDGSERMIVMRELAPDDFLQTEYYRLHYATTQIVDEIGFVIRMENDFVGVLSLSRTGAAPGRA